MRFAKKFNPEAALPDPDDPKNQHLRVVYLNVERQELVATDDRMMVVLPVEVEKSDLSGAIPVGAFAEARRQAPGPDLMARIICNRRGSVYVGRKRFNRPPAASLPSAFQGDTYVRVLPEERPGHPGTLTVSLCAFRLSQLVEAMGSEDAQVVLTFPVAQSRQPDPVFVCLDGYADAKRVPIGTLAQCRHSCPDDGEQEAMSKPSKRNKAGGG